MKKFLLLVALMGSISASAHAGTWGSSVFDHAVNVVDYDNLAVVAGTPYTSPAGGSCTSGDVFKYYVDTNKWTCRLGVCRGQLYVYRQICN